MSLFHRGKLMLFGLPFVAFVAAELMLTLSAVLISDLPRPMQGGGVSAPWLGCLVGSIASSILLPWMAALPFLKATPKNGYFLLCLIVATVVLYLAGFDHLISKAYRTGL